MDTALALFGSLPWFAWIAITAIVCGSLSGIATAWFRHCERMAMIRQGMHPDLDPDAASQAARHKSMMPEL